MKQYTPWRPQKYQDGGEWWIIECAYLVRDFKNKGIRAEIKLNNRNEVSVWIETRNEVHED